MEEALIGRYPTANRENHDRDDQSPEIKLFPITERVRRISRSFAAANPQQHQTAVTGIDHRVNAFGEHGRAAREASSDKFGHRDRQVCRDSRIDDFSRFGCHSNLQHKSSASPLRPIEIYAANWCKTRARISRLELDLSDVARISAANILLLAGRKNKY